jgi:bifunctional non-homologous end joining protein LigD
MCPVALSSRMSSLARLPGAHKSGVPAYIGPCDPTIREYPTQGDDWFYEINAGGYRAQLHCHAGKVRVYSRTGPIRDDRGRRSCVQERDVVIDGEAVVYGSSGLPDVQQLRRELCATKSPRVLWP